MAHLELAVLVVVLVCLAAGPIRRRIPLLAATPWYVEIGIWALFVYVCLHDVVAGGTPATTGLNHLLVQDAPLLLAATLGPIAPTLKPLVILAAVVIAVALAARAALLLRRRSGGRRRHLVIAVAPGGPQPAAVALESAATFREAVRLPQEPARVSAAVALEPTVTSQEAVSPAQPSARAAVDQGLPLVPRPAPEPAHSPTLLDARKAAALLGISRSSLYRLARDGSLPHRRQGRRMLFRRQDLESAFGQRGPRRRSSRRRWPLAG